jgi:glycosyltransferase involved in cell wall biosynthesis
MINQGINDGAGYSSSGRRDLLAWFSLGSWERTTDQRRMSSKMERSSMNILFLTLAWPENSEHNLYTDLMDEFLANGHTVYVVAARERRIGKATEYCVKGNLHVLRVKCGNIQKTGPIEKGLSSVHLGYQMQASMKKHLPNTIFDLIIYSTPPITLAKTVKTLKKKHGAKTYLLLKDIWPQGPADMGAIRQNGLIWMYFRQMERLLYRISDYIGCLSPANVRYVFEHNKELPHSKVEECPNTIKPREHVPIDPRPVRKKYGVPEGPIVFLFGGNLGKPQGIGFLLDAAEAILDREGVFFVIVGSGTEYSKIKTQIEDRRLKNMLLLERLPTSDYEELCGASDVGLILLDRCFTIPNFPSRLLSYLDIGMPVLCATDDVCDVGDIVEEWNCGIKTLHGDLNGFLSAIDRLANDDDLRTHMSQNARRLLEQKYTAKHSYEIIMKHFR